MKFILSYILLFAVSLLLVPRSWVHDCEHHHAESHHHQDDSDDQDHNNDKDSGQEDEGCFVCDLDLETGVLSEFTVYHFTGKEVLKPVFTEFNEPLLSQVFFYKDRGPPYSC